MDTPHKNLADEIENILCEGFVIPLDDGRRVVQALRDLERALTEAQRKLAEAERQLVLHELCEKHQGYVMAITATYHLPLRKVCPICEQKLAMQESAALDSARKG